MQILYMGQSIGFEFLGLPGPSYRVLI